MQALVKSYFLYDNENRHSKFAIISCVLLNALDNGLTKDCTHRLNHISGKLAQVALSELMSGGFTKIVSGEQIKSCASENGKNFTMETIVPLPYPLALSALANFQFSP